MIAPTGGGCYALNMEKVKNTSKSLGDRSALIAISVLFVVVLCGAWLYAMNLRQTVMANNAVVNVNPAAVVEIERLRHLAESQISTSRSYFLLGSKALFDRQKQEKETMLESLAKFEKQYTLSQIPEIVQRIVGIEKQLQDVFDQGQEFRDKQTESKIVGQFYQAKTSPLAKQLNDAFNEIVNLHEAELNRARTEAQQAALGVEARIPKGMTWLTILLVGLFAGLGILVLRLLSGQKRHVAERARLVAAAKTAIEARDEVVAAISQDLKEPLSALNDVAERLTLMPDASRIEESAELIRSSVMGIEALVKDICDQKNVAMGGLTLRFDQLPIDDVLEDARQMLQPLAKQRDIRLQFDPSNPPALAFFDRERVLRVLWNLVGNAIKFSPQNSRIVVKARSDQQFVHISVADSGPGIPEKQLPQLFDDFWQAPKTADQGAGVGLSVVKTIVEAHGGTLQVNSHSGHGSTFTFSLPRRRPAGAQLKRPPPVRSTARNAPPMGYTDGPTI